jgi:hypothetical protein
MLKGGQDGGEMGKFSGGRASFKGPPVHSRSAASLPKASASSERHHNRPRMEIPAGSSTDDGADACVICLSDIAERATTVPCKHDNFDFLCLASWLQNRSTCPLCEYCEATPPTHKPAY